MDELLPTSLAVFNALSEQSEAFLELLEALRESVDADLQNHAMLIAYAQSWIDGLINSTGGWESKDLDPLEEEWYNHPIWLYIKRWIHQGIHDSIYGNHQTNEKYWKHCQYSNDLMVRFNELVPDKLRTLMDHTTYKKEWTGLIEGIICDRHVWTLGDTADWVKWRIDVRDGESGFYALGYSGLYTNSWLYVGLNREEMPEHQEGYNFLCIGNASIAGVDIEQLNSRVQELEKKVEQYEDQSEKIAALEAKVARLEKLLAYFVQG